MTALCSEGSMFRRFYVQKIFVQKVLCSEGPMFRRSFVQKVLYSVQEKNVQKVLYSEGSMFRRFYIQIYSEGPIFRKFFVLRGKNLHLSVSGKLQCKITNHSLSFLVHSVKGKMSVLSWRVVRRQFAKIAIGTSINIVNSHKPGVITKGLSPQFRNMTLL